VRRTAPGRTFACHPAGREAGVKVVDAARLAVAARHHLEQIDRLVDEKKPRSIAP